MRDLVFRFNIGDSRLTLRMGAWPMVSWWPGFARRLAPIAARPKIIHRAPWKLDDEALF